ncbi:mannose-P-dolichol utilization defect 1 protein homolog [Fopius arisanus]|uniref:Mannose-P-dolichol utilization defect 1 protein homolog n=1 Tax=Fopius arisanus TaxID=64838 RepID=A0A0C9R4Z4_9HYME|nr:PREDICTED: mannose-P-dolichol utilization defect 1 protein homolog [Fopius arisanus]
MEYIASLPRLLFSDECLKEYFTNFNFLHAQCFKATLSKGLGLGIIAGSFMVKVPQVIKIFNNKSSEGINFASVLLDLFAITAMISYSFVSGFPFSAWGDGVFLGIQTLAIAILVLHYRGDTAKAIAFLVAYLSIIIAVITGLTPLNVLWGAQSLTIPIVLISKLFQAHTNYKNGSTGQLSAVTMFMLLFGSMARIFTSIQETGDTNMIIMYICSTSANAIIVGQLLYYWNVGAENKKKTKKIK